MSESAWRIFTSEHRYAAAALATSFIGMALAAALPSHAEVRAGVAAGAPVRQAAPATPAGVKTKVNDADGLSYVWIAPGTFKMGCSQGDPLCDDDEKPAHMVTLSKGFWIGQTPVTQAAYKKVTGQNWSHFKGDDLPVDQMSYDNAVDYCQKVGMRLPTEAEWEYAARGGDTAARYGKIEKIAWYGPTSMGTTHPVGKLLPNAYGLYDMLGNVDQWVADYYGPYGKAAQTDPTGAASSRFRTLRGGSWNDDYTLIRASSRVRNQPLDQYNYFGIRCAGN